MSTNARRFRDFVRPHLSTCVILFVLATGLAAINVLPGDDERGTQNWDFFCIERGWPWPFLSQYLMTFEMDDLDLPPWRRGISWRDFTWQKRTEFNFDGAALAEDFGFAALVLCILGSACEWRRRRRPRFWQFTLLEFTLFLSGLAAGFGLARLTWNEHQRNTAACRRIGQAGHYVRLMYNGPRWLEKLVGRRSLQELYRPEGLYLQNVDDDAVESLLPAIEELSGLKYLYLRESTVTAKTLSQFALPHLVTLDLRRSRITNGDLAALSRYPELRYLWLSDAGITDDGMRHLKNVSNLESLVLSGTHLSDRGVIELQALGRLTSLNVSNTLVTASGVQTMTRLGRLEKLEIDYFQLNDGTIDALRNMRNLQELTICGASFSDAQCERLRRQLPKLALMYVDSE